MKSLHTILSIVHGVVSTSKARRFLSGIVSKGIVFVCLSWWVSAAMRSPGAAEPEGRTVSRTAMELAAFSEMVTLAEAEELACVDTGYFVSLENLDDILVDGSEPDYNFIGDGGGTPVIDPAAARFKPLRADLLHGLLAWKGPYVAYQQGKTDADNVFQYDRGTPLDPWGSPYHFYTPAGLVRPPLAISLENWGDYFDRYAIVSYGPDGQHAGGDDLIYYFGTAPTRLVLTSVSPLSMEVGDTLTLKGYKLDTAGADVLFNGTEANAGILVREPARILKRIEPGDPLGEVVVALQAPGQDPTTSFTIHVEPRRAGARFWELF